jgi:hypothetical protein
MGGCTVNRNEGNHGYFIEGNKSEKPFCFIGLVEVKGIFSTGILLKNDVVLTSKRIVKDKKINEIKFYPAGTSGFNTNSFSNAIEIQYKDDSIDEFALVFLEKEITLRNSISNENYFKNKYFLTLHSPNDTEIINHSINIYSYASHSSLGFCLFEQNIFVKDIKLDTIIFDYNSSVGVSGGPAIMTINEKQYLIGFNTSIQLKSSFKRFSKEDLKVIIDFNKAYSKETNRSKEIKITSSLLTDTSNTTNIRMSTYSNKRKIRKNDYIYRVVDDLNIDRPFCFIGIVKTNNLVAIGILIQDNIVLTTANILYDKSSFKYTEKDSLLFIPGKNRDNSPFDSIKVNGYYFNEKYKYSDEVSNFWAILILERKIGEVINKRFKKNKYYAINYPMFSILNDKEYTFFNYSSNNDINDILVEGKGPIEKSENCRNSGKFYLSDNFNYEPIGGLIFMENNSKKYIVGLQTRMNDNHEAEGLIFSKELTEEITSEICILKERYHVNNDLRKSAFSKKNFNDVESMNDDSEAINLKKIKINTEHNDIVLSILYLPNYESQNDIIATFCKKEIKLWKITTSKLIKQIDFADIFLTCILYIEDRTGEKFFCYGSSDNYVNLLSISGESEKIVLSGHSDYISCIIQLKNIDDKDSEYLLLSGSKDMSLRLWNYKTRENLFTMEGHEWYIYSLVFLREYGNSKDHIASGSGDYTVVIWKYSENEPVRVLKGHKNVVISLIYPCKNEEKDILVSGSYQEIRVWKISTGECINSLKGHDDKISSLVYLGDFYKTKDIFASASVDCSIKFWRPYLTDHVKRIDTGDSNPIVAMISLDKKVLGKNAVCCVTNEATIKLFDIESIFY